ncbi:MAG: hypothetical protein IJB57_05465 [Clostridia bacterium]|nr:hypothetical protein [Clostridia bacterium]
MKRKALITATAVLLVAVMCLATASYAWFTAGGATTVTTINLSVSEGDALGLVIAPANAQDGSYDAGIYTTSALSAQTLADYAIIPENGKLLPVSTAGTFANTKDGYFDFWEAPADTFDGKYWDSNVAEHDEYVLFSFYVKATTTGDYKVNFTSTLLGHTDFVNTCKIGYNVAEATETAGVPAGTPGALTIGRPNPSIQNISGSAYKPLVADGGASIQDIYNDTVNGEFAANVDGLLGDTIDDDVIASVPLSFSAVDEVQLVTVAIWVEGQDYDTKGSVEITAADFVATLAEA